MPFINRFTTTTQGAMTFTGNTLGLSKESNTNNSGILHSIGAFITLNTVHQVPTYPFPPGTTLNWQENSSQANLVIPAGSTILYAELIWAGQYRTGTVDESAFINQQINFTTPIGTSSISPDPATVFNMTFGTKLWYVRSANVTSLVHAAGAGAYSVGGIVGTVLNTDNSTNAAGWTLAVVYGNASLPTRNMTLFVGAEVISTTTGNIDTTISGFIAPPTGPINARILVSASEGDTNITGDQLLFGETIGTISNLSGPRNTANNFFASQINDDSGNLDTSGSFGNQNHNSITATNIVAGRQGWDITNVDGSAQMNNGQTSAVVRFTTGGDAYSPNALGVQIDSLPTEEPDIEVIKCTDKLTVTNGEIITFTIIIKNTGTADAENCELTDTIPTGMEFIPTTVAINGVSNVSANPNNGIDLGIIKVDDIVTVTFMVMVDAASTPVEITNNATLDYEYFTIADTAVSNDVTILVKDDLTNQDTLYYYADTLQDFANDFCNNVIPTIVNLISTDINKVVDILESELCSCKNNEDLIAKGVCDIAKDSIEDDRCM
ncbi:hypothetical protein [Oceanirhabdus sp. W0125-5]|uniref:hypothetical protein n=1 Tax=Oceanirhabdus sp. W0125-5 TaxID=2999116 RepID=UPI0022F3451B|nr:hypothetical protein [Oceanirhabdus sp. W0125-5]WBW96576.1 hypothetical protein OW730_23225 [Oceanirhabdus sp. W0125-5]